MTKVLLVEDEAPIRDMVRFALSREGIEMAEADSVASALSYLEGQLPDLILLDWMLPDESGLSMLRRLRKAEQWARIPVMMLTARAEESYKVQGLESGADDYVTKPFSPKELMARIKAVLRRSEGREQDGTLKIGDLTLMPAAHRVVAHGKNIDLGPTEFRLLSFFMTHADRVFSRSQLLDYVWTTDADVEDRTVDVSIRRLRKALADVDCEEMVRTVRGAGYSFSADAT